MPSFTSQITVIQNRRLHKNDDDATVEIMKSNLNTLNAPALQATAIDTNFTSPGYQAFRILHLGFVVAPILAGLDKFFQAAALVFRKPNF